MFQLGEFKAHSGRILYWKIECDALSTNDWKCLAWIVHDLVTPFGSVEGVPTGGCHLANWLETYVTRGPLLIVDDVLTTGQSMEEYRAKRAAIGAVIFARGPCPKWITPVFQASHLSKRTM